MRGAALMLGLAAIVAAAPARAGEADDLIDRGVSLRKQNRDQEALALFKKAFEMQQTPRASAQLGLCEQALGLWVPAEEHLQGALASPDDRWVKKNAATLGASLARVRAKLGTIEVWGTPEGAQIAVDGEPAGKIPLPKPIRVVQGRRTVRVEAPGFATDTQTHDVEAGGLIRMHVALAPAAAPSPSAAPEPQRPAPPIVTGQPLPAEPVEATPVHRRWWFWAIVGAVVIAGGASAFLLTRNSDGCQSLAGGSCDKW